ncbi:MAG: L,D-transpeptidase family protein [Pseudomonadales bacterium]|nr:L,D-transpeptidase family protein [Pseudomonadales bacterium]
MKTRNTRPLIRPASFLGAVCTLAALLNPAAPAFAAAYSMAEADTQIVGALVPFRVRYEDTLAAVAEAQGLGWRELVDANPDVDPWLPGDGTQITLPTKYILPSGPREGVVINVSEFRLYYYPPGTNLVVTFPVGLGRLDFPTPLVNTTIRTAVPNPSWSPGPTARAEHAARGTPLPAVVPPGPDNPMGSMAIVLGIPSYFIHGTNQPFAVGQTASLGCIRMYDHHVETLAEMTRRGTPVRIVNEPYKVGWRDGELYVEIHEDIYGMTKPGELEERVRAATDGRGVRIDWSALEALAEKPSGVPTRI